MFSYEAHAHSAEVSRCGQRSAREQVTRYHELGYTGIVFTDHLHESYIQSCPWKDDWESCVEHYLLGYELAKAAAAPFDMDVLFGMELRFMDCDRDFLVYGADRKWLAAHPYPYRLGVERFFERFCDTLFIVHAHPYRGFDEERDGPLRTDCVHGVELVNANPRHDSHNEWTLELCRREPALYRLCGSDAHRAGDEGQAAVLLPYRVATSRAFADAVRAGDAVLKSPAYQSILDAAAELPAVRR